MLILEVNNCAIFTKFEELFPECNFLIKDEEKLFPLICLKDTCHRNMNCMEKLAKRIKYLFDLFTNAKILILYFRYRDKPNSLRAGVFWRDFEVPPKYITMNPGAWGRFKEIGTIYDITFPSFIEIENKYKVTSKSLPIIKD